MLDWNCVPYLLSKKVLLLGAISLCLSTDLRAEISAPGDFNFGKDERSRCLVLSPSLRVKRPKE